MDVRMAVAFFLQAGPKLTVTEFCAQNGIKRATFYKFKKRFEAGGLEALVPRSRRPHTSPTATTPQMMTTVIQNGVI